MNQVYSRTLPPSPPHFLSLLFSLNFSPAIWRTFIVRIYGTFQSPIHFSQSVSIICFLWLSLAREATWRNLCTHKRLHTRKTERSRVSNFELRLNRIETNRMLMKNNIRNERENEHTDTDKVAAMESTVSKACDASSRRFEHWKMCVHTLSIHTSMDGWMDGWNAYWKREKIIRNSRLVIPFPFLSHSIPFRFMHTAYSISTSNAVYVYTFLLYRAGVVFYYLFFFSNIFTVGYLLLVHFCVPTTVADVPATPSSPPLLLFIF